MIFEFQNACLRLPGENGLGFSTVMMSRILGNNPSPITQQGSVPITVGGRLNKKSVISVSL